MSNSCNPMDCSPTRLLCPWDSPGKNTGVDCHFLLQGSFPTHGLTRVSCVAGSLYQLSYKGSHNIGWGVLKMSTRLMSVSHSVVSDSVIPWTIALGAPLSMEFSRQEYWSGLPFPSPGDLPDPMIEPQSPALQASVVQNTYRFSVYLFCELPRKVTYYFTIMDLPISPWSSMCFCARRIAMIPTS